MDVEETRARALESISTALGTLNRALDSLREARDWASYDLWWGGLMAGHRKRESIRRVHGHVRSAQWTLDSLRNDLERLDLDPVVGASDGRLVAWGDVWFDNLVSDVLTRRRLTRLDADLNRISRELVVLQSRLSRAGQDTN